MQLHPEALIYSVQETTPGFEHQALHMLHTLILSLLLHLLPSPAAGYTRHLICAAPLMAQAGGNLPGC